MNPTDTFPKVHAEEAFARFGIPKETINPSGNSGYSAVIIEERDGKREDMRYIFQGAMQKEVEVFAQLVNVHNHEKTEINTVKDGTGHFLTPSEVEGQWIQRFLTTGDTIATPDKKQYVLVISRENQNNPQLIPANRSALPEALASQLAETK